MSAKKFWEDLYRKKLRLFLVVGFLLGGIWLLFDLLVPLLNGDSKGQVVITGHSKLQKEEIFKAMGMNRSSKIHELNMSVLEKQLLAHPRIKTATVIRRSGTQILVTVRERKTNFVVSANDALYEIDEEGRILSIDDVRDTTVCVLSGDFRPEQGFFKGASFQDLVNSVTRSFRVYPDLRDRISEVHVRKTGGIVVYIHKPKRIRVLMGNVLDSTQIRKLYAALAYFEARDISAQMLDLRGDDAVFQ
jgi:cell division protein FtsQ